MTTLPPTTLTYTRYVRLTKRKIHTQIQSIYYTNVHYQLQRRTTITIWLAPINTKNIIAKHKTKLPYLLEPPLKITYQKTKEATDDHPTTNYPYLYMINLTQ